MSLLASLQRYTQDLRRHDSVLWRRAARAGAVYGPDAFVRYSPPLFGLAFGASLPRYRKAVLRNVRLARGRRSPLAESWDVARTFASYAHCLTEAFVTGAERPDRLFVNVLRDEHYVAAISKGRGVIIATAHTGGWQVAGPALGWLHPEEVLVVMQNERDERAQAVQDTARDQEGMRTIYIGTDALSVLPLLSHLRQGGALALQMDRVPVGMRSRMVSFLGEPRAIPEGPLQLAALSGAPIVTVVTRRLDYMCYEVMSTPPIELPRRPTARQLDAAAQAIADALGAYVRENPTQWFNFE